MRVIVLNADGLPAWAVGAYGNDWLATPNLDEFAGGAVVFDRHFADVPRRLSRDNVSGRLPFAGDAPASAVLPPEVEWVDAPPLLPPWEVEVSAGEGDDLAPLPDPTPGLIDPDDDETFERLRFTFGAAVEAFDACFGDWLSAHMAELRDALVILTGGRGQNLGEHGLIGEAWPWLHEELVHLPLIVRLPGGAEAGRRVPHLTQTVDLSPTILAALGLSVPPDGHGHDLLPLCRGGRPVRDYLVMASAGGEEFALQTPHEKIIVPAAAVVRSLRDGTPGHGVTGPQPRAAMYFVKPDDRWEVNDLRLPNLDHAERLEQTLRDYLAAGARPGPLNVPPLPTSESADGDRETGGREHDRPAGAGGLRGHQGDAEGRADQ